MANVFSVIVSRRIFSIALACITIAVTILSACAVGTNFTRPDPNALIVGKTTSGEVIQLMGSPRQVGEGMKNDERIKTLQYAYSFSHGEATYPSVVPGRSMAFVTHNDVLVAKEFVSSFKEDGTDFDDSKIANLVKGKTTRAQVIEILGKANGEAIYPVIKGKNEHALVYSYAQVKRDGMSLLPKLYRKALVISFTQADVVSDVEFNATGDK